MNTYNTIYVIDGITNGIAKMVRKKTNEGIEYFNVYTTSGFERTDICCDNPHVSLTKEDTLKLINNIKNKQTTFIGITNNIDKIINENILIEQNGNFNENTKCTNMTIIDKACDYIRYYFRKPIEEVELFRKTMEEQT